MNEKSILDDFLKRAHLRACGSNNVTDCGEECAYMKDAAFSELGRLTGRLERVEATLVKIKDLSVRKFYTGVFEIAAAALDTPTGETK